MIQLVNLVFIDRRLALLGIIMHPMIWVMFDYGLLYTCIQEYLLI